MRRRQLLRGVLARLGLLAAALGLCALALELGLRAFWTGYYLKGPRAYVTGSATRGWANTPSTVAVYGEPEFRITVSHNSLGFRGPEVAPEKTPGRRRVLVLGDSFVYGIGVADDETFCARLAQLDPGLEVINTGVNGYGTAHQLLLLRDQGLALRPDVVLVGFFWNDVGNSYNGTFPRFRLEGDRLVWPEPQAAAPALPGPQPKAWRRHSYAYRFLSDRLILLVHRVKTLLQLPIETSDFVDPGERDAAWQLEAALLREIRDLASSVGAVTALAVIPDQVQVESDHDVVGLDPADYAVDERVRRIASQERIPRIDLLPALRAEHARRGERLYYPVDRHLNARGHEVVARVLREELAALLR